MRVYAASSEKERLIFLGAATVGNMRVYAVSSEKERLHECAVLESSAGLGALSSQDMERAVSMFLCRAVSHCMLLREKT